MILGDPGRLLQGYLTSSLTVLGNGALKFWTSQQQVKISIQGWVMSALEQQLAVRRRELLSSVQLGV